MTKIKEPVERGPERRLIRNEKPYYWPEVDRRANDRREAERRADDRIRAAWPGPIASPSWPFPLGSFGDID